MYIQANSSKIVFDFSEVSAMILTMEVMDNEIAELARVTCEEVYETPEFRAEYEAWLEEVEAKYIADGK